MASTFSSDLKLELMATGENAGTWGTKTNTNLELVQQAIAGFESIALSSGSTTTLVMSNASISTARFTLDASKIYAAYADGTNLNEVSLDTLGGTIGTASIADDAITSAKIADDAVVSAAIADNAVLTVNISNVNVTTAKIANNAITADKLERKFTISTSSPSGGNDGDIWFKYS